MRVTVFGAISTCLQDFRAFKLAKSTNKEDYCSFLLQIKQSVQQKYRSHKLILCYDGARAHTAKYSMDFIKDLFIPLQIPVMSCEFNCKYHRYFAKTNTKLCSLQPLRSSGTQASRITTRDWWHSKQTYQERPFMQWWMKVWLQFGMLIESADLIADFFFKCWSKLNETRKRDYLLLIITINFGAM